jgi:multisubunit Na+/H+ antiporter MnhF subunit
MTAWTSLAFVLLAAIAVASIAAVRGKPPSAAIALSAASTAGAGALLVLAARTGPAVLYDTAIVFVVLSFTGTLVFLHYIDVL